MPDILHTPNRERIVASNAWAFLHWLRITRGIDMPDWGALQRFSVDRQGEFRAAVVAFSALLLLLPVPGEPNFGPLAIDNAADVATSTSKEELGEVPSITPLIER